LKVRTMKHMASLSHMRKEICVRLSMHSPAFNFGTLTASHLRLVQSLLEP
jgi:hypothetical protein